MHRLITSALAALLCIPLWCQVTLEECMSLARDNYPQIKELDLISASEKYDLANASFSWIPQLTVSGKATWQSDVVEMPFDFQGYSFDIPHYQYGITGDITQQIWDGGVTANRRDLVKAGAEVKRKQLEVNLYSIRSRVLNIYLGILLIDRQIDLNNLLQETLKRNEDEVKSLIDNGMANSSDMDQLKVKILDCEQQRASLEADRTSYIRMLGLLTGKSLEGLEFETPPDYIPGMMYFGNGNPGTATDSFDAAVLRPEIALYDAQLEQAKFQMKQLNTAISPKFNLTVQAGYGRPGLNMLSGKFAPYITAGLRMQWNFGSLYTLKNDRRKVESDYQKVELTRKSFLLNTAVEAEDKNNEITKARDVLSKDGEIIELRERIRKSGEIQYQEGVLKMTDLMSMFDDEHKARLNESLHRIQLLMAIYSLQDTLGAGND
ncbi:MAG: TolC family protein [Candidatus Cryptobacteroides sp.]